MFLPMVVINCVTGSALLSAIFLALATYQSIYPLTLCVPALLYLLQVNTQTHTHASTHTYLIRISDCSRHSGVCVCVCPPSPQRLYIPVNVRRSSFWFYTLQYLFMFLGSLLVLICLSFFLLGSWDFLPAVYGFM